MKETQVAISVLLVLLEVIKLISQSLKLIFYQPNSSIRLSTLCSTLCYLLYHTIYYLFRSIHCYRLIHYMILKVQVYPLYLLFNVLHMHKKYVLCSLLALYSLPHAIKGDRYLAFKLLHLLLNFVLEIYNLYLESLCLILKSFRTLILLSHVDLKVRTVSPVHLSDALDIGHFVVQPAFKVPSMAVALENFLEQILILSCLLDDAHDTDFMILNLLATQVNRTLH
jgi:hypothetical protein